MTDPAATPADPVDDPKVDDPPAVPDPKPDPAPADDFDKDRAMATIKAQRDTEKDLKAQLREAQKAAAELQTIKDAEKTELEREREARERLEAENATNSERLQALALKDALTNPEYGIADPALAATLLKERVTFEDGEPQNLDEAVKSLLTAHPLLKSAADSDQSDTPDPPDIDAGAGQGNGPAPSLTAEELDMAKKLNQDPKLYAELKRVNAEKDGQMTYEDYLAAQERVKANTT